MRHINIERLEVDEDWKQDAQDALDETRQKAEGVERSNYINSKSTIWSVLKPKLEKLSEKKCWYCEAREDRSDRAVDHYRPKNNVRNSDPPHKGYWWLAFEHTNYRLSCTFCNSRRADRETGEVGGKGDYFPLEDETQRVCVEGGNCKQELPLLLDPCKLSDVALLWFSDDGRVIPKYDKDQKPLAFKRADSSIGFYNLNERDVKEERQKVYTQIKELIDEGDYYFEDYLNGDANAGYAIGKVMIKLSRLTKKGAEFSAFAKAIVLGFRQKGREWMDSVDLAEEI